MTERLTWAEIKRRYPDEWVLVAEPEFDDDLFPVRATVVHHSQDRDAVEEWPVPSGTRHEGLFFTGRLFDPNLAYVL